MGLLSLNHIPQAASYLQTPVPGARMYVYADGVDVLARIFADSGLTDMRANPAIATAVGQFELCYLVDGTYRIELRDRKDRLLLELSNIVITPDSSSTTPTQILLAPEGAIIRDFLTVREMLADVSLTYGTGAGLQTVVPGEMVTAGANFSYVVVPQNTTDHHLETAGGVKLYVRDQDGQFSLEAFGADASGTQDCSERFMAALGAVRQLNAINSYRLEGASASSNPRYILDLGTGTYLLSQVVEIAHIGAIEIVGRSAVISGDFADYLLRFTGRCLNLRFKGLVFESTSVGCIDFDALNLSSARVQFVDCRFATDAFEHESGIAVLYENRSSALSFERCFFNRIKHPVHVTNCDFISFYDCWFGFPTFAAYEDRDGYIRCDKGFLDINRCLFAGGPSWYSGKTYRGGAPMPEYREVAFINIGVAPVALGGGTYQWTAAGSGTNEYYLQTAAGGDPALPYTAGHGRPWNVQEGTGWMEAGTAGALTPGAWDYADNDGLGYETIYVRLSDNSNPNTVSEEHLRSNLGARDVDQGRVSISDTRIGYEWGAGPLINWFVANKGSEGQAFRGGIELRNIQTSPREEKEIAADRSTVATPLLRLFEMPHQIILNGIHGNPGNMALLASGTTTTLSDLRRQAAKTQGDRIDFAKQMSPRGAGTYSIADITTLNLHMSVAPTGVAQEENAHWLALFGAFDYFFASDYPLDSSAGNTVLATIETFFSDFSDDRRGAIFEVSGGALGAVSNGNVSEVPIFGYVSVVRDETGTDRLFTRFRTALDTSDAQPQVTVTAKFDVSGVRSAAIPTTDAATATLVLEVTHMSNPGIANIRCAGLCVRPISTDWTRTRGAAVIQAYL